MARRRTRSKKTRRRSPKRTNVLNVAQSVILGNAVTQGLFNTNMFEFVTGRIGGAYTPGAISQSSQITLPELLGAGMGVQGAKTTVFGGKTYTTGGTNVGYGGIASPSTLSSAIQDNLKNNGVSMLTTMVVTPIAFKVISGLARKPRSEFNKLARNIGLPISM